MGPVHDSCIQQTSSTEPEGRILLTERQCLTTTALSPVGGHMRLICAFTWQAGGWVNSVTRGELSG